MTRYKCPRCKGNQYSASQDKANEPCIYCGHEGTELMKSLEEGYDEELHEPDRPRTPCDDTGPLGLFKHMAGANQLPNQRQEVEENIGLIWYNPATGSLTTKKKAIHRNIEISAELLLYVIMNRLDSDRLPFTSDKAEYWREWLDNKISYRELGYQVRSKLLDRISELEQELRRYRDYKKDQEELKAIDAVMEKHGIRSYWRRAETLDEALSRGYPKELDNLQRKLQEAAASIEKLKKTYQEEETVYERA